MKKIYVIEHISRYEAGSDGFVGVAEIWETAKKIMDSDWDYFTARERKRYGDEYAITAYSVTDDEFCQVWSNPAEVYMLDEQGLMIEQEIYHMNHTEEDKTYVF